LGILLLLRQGTCLEDFDPQGAKTAMDLSNFPEQLSPLTPTPGEWTPRYPKLCGGLEYHGWMSSDVIATFARLMPFNEGAQEIVMYLRDGDGRLRLPLVTSLVGIERIRVGSARPLVRHAVLWGHYEAITASAELATRALGL